MLEALENGVSKYPVKEGRFPQVAGMSYGFDPTHPPGKRVGQELVKVQDEYIDPDKVRSSVCVVFVYLSV